MAENIKGRL